MGAVEEAEGAVGGFGVFGVMAEFLGRGVGVFGDGIGEGLVALAAGVAGEAVSAARVRIPDNASQAVIKERVAIQRRMRDG